MLKMYDVEEILSDQEYNQKLDEIYEKAARTTSYYLVNNFVMNHTYAKCRLDSRLQEAISNTLSKQFVLYEEDWNKEKLSGRKENKTSNIIISKKRSFEAAKAYKNKKVAVLNFANNHHVGGSPWSAGAQEESLCKCSTLFECLCHEKESFYQKHDSLFSERKMNEWGNGDLIYSPEIVVFKTDESAPKMMNVDDWYKVDVITMAAPQFMRGGLVNGNDYQQRVLPRLRNMFEVAKTQGVEVLILGAWGCGAFHNPTRTVAKTFQLLCEEYQFDTIEFAIYCREEDLGDNYHVFKEVFEK